MSSARPVTAASGNPPAMPLAVVIMSGTMPSCSLANIAPVRANPVWTSSAMNTMPLAPAPVGQRGQEARRRHDEATLTRIGSITSEARFVGADLRLDRARSPRAAALPAPSRPSRNG